MNEYTVEVTLTVKITAPDESDVEDVVEDYFGLGAGGEGVNVTAINYTINR